MIKKTFVSLFLVLVICLLTSCGSKVITSEVIHLSEISESDDASSGDNTSSDSSDVNSSLSDCKPGKKHKYSEKFVNPTCTKKGYTLFTCKYCKKTYKDNYVDPSHKFGEWKVIREATGTEMGLKQRKCSACGKKENSDLPAKGAVNTSELLSLISRIPDTYEDFVDGKTAYEIKEIVEYASSFSHMMTEQEVKESIDKLNACLKNYELQYDDIDQVFITHKGRLSKDEYINCTVSIIKARGSLADSVGDKNSTVKIRGNLTSDAPKSPLNFKFSKQRSVLGMEKAKKWSLLSNPYDPSLLRCALASQLAQNMNLIATPEFRYVDVWINGKYFGNYVLFESIEAGPGRVDINTDKDEFLIELEHGRTDQGTAYVETERFGRRFAIKDPSRPSNSEIALIMNKLEKIEKYMEECTLSELSKYIDIDSFIDYYIVNELFESADFSGLSEFYYYKDGKLYAGPVWDYDLSSGNFSEHYARLWDEDGNSYTKWCAKRSAWYRVLLENEEFKSRVVARYAEVQPLIRNLYEPVGTNASLIDQLTTKYAASMKRNFAIWDIMEHTSFQITPKPTHKENVDVLINWLRNRNGWLLENLK